MKGNIFDPEPQAKGSNKYNHFLFCESYLVWCVLVTQKCPRAQSQLGTRDKQKLDFEKVV